MMEISCLNCGNPYPVDDVPYLCQVCGGLFDLCNTLPFDPLQVDRNQPGIWRYRHSFGFSTETEQISLGEGNTPLVWSDVLGRKVAFKCEFLNPSGSFKDRGSTILATFLRSRGINQAVEDSSGNAGASFAAYASRAGIKARIFIPDTAAGPKVRQIEAYGAELILVPGTREDVARAVKEEADKGCVYASHAYQPFNLAGYATAAFEIYEQLGCKIPGSVVLPVGQGGLLLGLVQGFKALRITTNSYQLAPKMIGVQVMACAPLWALSALGKTRVEEEPKLQTLAEGVRVIDPVRKTAVVKEVVESQGTICRVGEEEIISGRNSLAQFGFYVEPTSAIVWPGLKQIINECTDPVVVILTGNGLKQE
jgi:threonine synthase